MITRSRSSCHAKRIMFRKLLPFLTLAALALLFYRQAAFTNLIFARGDTLLYFYPYWDYRAQALLAGRLPLWNPYLFMGAPFLANSQAGVFYPLNWPLIFFPAPIAVKISLVAHVIIAAWGAYLLARRVFALEPFAATFAAAVFAFGGYLTAQVEHVNQLQGLAWLPFALLATHSVISDHAQRSVITRSGQSSGSEQPSFVLRPAKRSFVLSLIIALQLTAGHTQTAFITLVACGLVAAYSFIVSRLTSRNHLQITPSGYGLRITFFTLALTLAFTLSAIQLLPTLELSRLSLRGGGLPLNEAVSFSLNPLLLGRALLPGYSRVIFSEFVAYIGIVPLSLALFGLLAGINNHRLNELHRFKLRFPSFHALLRITNYELLITDYRLLITNPIFLALLLAGLGLFFALGGYNPLYLLLARFAPGFNLFRVPARWLALWALGAAMLAGFGLQQIRNPTPLCSGDYRQQSREAVSNQKFALVFIGLLLLIASTFLSANTTPAGELGPIGFPSAFDLILWSVPLALFTLPFVASRITFHASRLGFWNLGFWFLGFGVLEIFLAASSLPLNHLTAPDAYTSIRPAMTQLLSDHTFPQSSLAPSLPQFPSVPSSPPFPSLPSFSPSPNPQPPTPNPYPPARFLSLSALEFDPGDLRELQSEWVPQLPPDAVYDAIIATKHKEVLSPNLPLTWQTPAVDGYDGGILPLRTYAEFVKQFGDAPANTDGRLRQFLKTVPPNWLLNLTNTRWIITDKTGDAWVDNIFYDLGLTATATSSTPLTLSRLPDFQATALGLVLGEDSQSGAAQIIFTDGKSMTLPITYTPAQPAIRLRWERPASVKQIDLLTPTQLTLRGASLIDERTDTFSSITLGPYRLAHSGDVKIYENLNVLPRAFVVSNHAQRSVISNQLSYEAASNSSFVFRPSSIVFLKYEAEHVVIQTSTDTPGYLVLTDTNYPGWIAMVDNQPASIETAYGLFRAVPITAGTHTIEFRFEPQTLQLGALISAVSLLLIVALFVFSALPFLTGISPRPKGCYA